MLNYKWSYTNCHYCNIHVLIKSLKFIILFCCIWQRRFWLINRFLMHLAIWSITTSVGELFKPQCNADLINNLLVYLTMESITLRVDCKKSLAHLATLLLIFTHGAHYKLNSNTNSDSRTSQQTQHVHCMCKDEEAHCQRCSWLMIFYQTLQVCV